MEEKKTALAKLPTNALASQRVRLDLWLTIGAVWIAIVVQKDLSAQPSTPLPCVPPPVTDGAPWIARARILGSFPADSPTPEFLGGFTDEQAVYEVHLWKDAVGVFGEFLYPVLEADSPTSRLHETTFNSSDGAIGFSLRLPSEKWTFTGHLGPVSLAGSLHRRDKSESLILRRLPLDDVHGALEHFYISRAHFECAMVLFHRR